MTGQSSCNNAARRRYSQRPGILNDRAQEQLDEVERLFWSGLPREVLWASKRWGRKFKDELFSRGIAMGKAFEGDGVSWDFRIESAAEELRRLINWTTLAEIDTRWAKYQRADDEQ